jgi:hypothetical protein
VLRTRGHDLTADEAKAACSYWAGHCDAEKHFKPGQNTPHYRITAKGIDTYEKSRV